jgi:7-keto-8-aminopelargonate synthetase-like enzyme
LRERLRSNTEYFREAMTAEGFTILPGEHPIVPVMFGDAVVAARMAELLLAKGVYVVAFSYPVVPMGKARIRTQNLFAGALAPRIVLEIYHCPYGIRKPKIADAAQWR